MTAPVKDFSFRGVLCSKDKSDVACWGVTEAKGPLQRLHFKLPPLHDDEVRIKVLYAGMCHTDCSMIDESWGPNAAHPLVPGHEIVAEIERVGAGIDKFKPGDQVCFGVIRDSCGKCELCRRGDDQLCNADMYKVTYDPYLGGYSTSMHVKASHVFRLPAGLPKEKAAPILCAGVTTFAPLRRWGTPGVRCGVIGIGGLGHMAIQFANKMGMHVVAISTSPTKEEEARKLGAREFVCSKVEEQMKHLMKSEPLDIIINTAFIHNITDYLYTLKAGGRFIQVGGPASSKPVVFNMLDLVCAQKSLSGSAAGSHTEVEQTLDFCDRFGVCPIVENYAWADLPKAYKRLQDGLPRYRCVIDVASTYDDK